MILKTGMTTEKMAAKLAAIATEWEFTGGDHPGFVVEFGDEKPWNDTWAEYFAELAKEYVFLYNDYKETDDMSRDEYIREELFEQLMANGFVEEAF